MIVRELFARLGMKTDAASFRRADKSLNKVKKVAATIAAIFVGGRVIKGFKNIVLETTAAADSVAKTSRKLGVGAQALQEYQFAAELSGVKISTFNMGLQRFARRTAEAAKGTGEAKEALKQMGIQLTDSQGNLRPADDLLLDVADSISKVTNEGERVRLAFKLFDSEGVSLINMLQGGRDGLQAMRDEAQKTGGVFSDEFLQASEEMTDQLLRLKMSGQGLKVMLATALLPATNAIVTWLMKTYTAIRQALEGTKILQVALGALAAAATVLVFVLGFKLFAAVGSLAFSLFGLAGGFTAAGAAALLMQIKMALIGVAFILLAGLILALTEEIVGAFTGMDTLGGKVADTMGELYDAFMKLGEGSPIIQALLLPIQAFLKAVNLAKEGLYALITLMTGGGFGGFEVLGKDVIKEAKDLFDKFKFASTIFSPDPKAETAGSKAGLPPSPEAAAVAARAGTVTSSQEVTINLTVQGASDPATTAKLAGEDIRQVLREENARALQALTAATAR